METRTTPVDSTRTGGEAPLLMRAEQAAALLCVGRSTLYALLASGELRPTRIGRALRVERAEVEAFVRRATDTTDRAA